MAAGLVIGGGITLTMHSKKDEVGAILISEKMPSLENYPLYYSHKNLSEDSIKNAVYCLHQSYNALSGNEKFQEKNIIEEYFPLLIKESLLRQEDASGNLLKSRTGAMGIAQIKDGAIQDAKKFLQTDFWISAEKYNPENMQDNCTLGMAYFIKNKRILKSKLPKELTFDDEFYYAAYNGGATRISEMMITFWNEKKKQHISWKEFAEWLSGKAIGIENNKNDIGFASQYNVEYNNFFQKSLVGNNDVLTFGSKVETTKEKIQEIINYVEVIDGIKYTDQSARQGEIVTKGSSFLYEDFRDEFHGDGLLDRISHKVWKATGSHSRYRQAMSIPGKWAFSILSSANVYPNQENLKAFYDINNLESDDIIKNKKYYLIPNIETPVSFDEWEDGRKEEVKNSQEQNSITSVASNSKMSPPNVDIFLQSIEVKNTSLLGKTFILDPGHGGYDTGAIFQAFDTNGKIMPYYNNDIKYISPGKYQITKNGKGDDTLYAIEANLVMDVSLRLAKLIRQNGGSVTFTHAFTDKINDNDIKGVTDKKNTVGQLDVLENDYVEWKPWKKFNKTYDRIKKARGRQDIRDRLLPDNQRNTYLFSIHIDSTNSSQDIPMIYYYNTDSQHNFAEKLMKNSDKVFKKDVAIANKKNLYILSDKPDDDKREYPQNGVLIELGNIQNKEFNARILTKSGRQEYAEGIFKAIEKSVKESAE